MPDSAGVETPQVGVYRQLSLFEEQESSDTSHPGATGEGGTGSGACEVCQTPSASGRGRALTPYLMERVCARDNLNRAYKKVKANKGSAGVDGMTVQQLGNWLHLHKDELIASLLDGSYRPQAVRGVQIPKPGGKGVRQLGIPTVVDRVVQQAILQVLDPVLDPAFSSSSFGFRRGVGAHTALKQACGYVKEGRVIVVDMDLSKFFDRVNHDMLMGRLADRINDKRLLRIIRRFLQAGLLQDGVCVRRQEGTPQGGPLSPLLANLLLDDLDKELERRGHKFCRYADDCNIYVRSKAAGERVMASITAFLEGTLKLKVNREKSAVAYVEERQFLGYRLLRGGRLGVAPKSVTRLKDRVRQITKRNRPRRFQQFIEDLNSYLSGWLTYFKLASCKALLHDLDEWIRRKLRCVRLKQCKRVWPMAKFLMSCGLKEEWSW
ncbi:group II intron reverse transcriptase/maturase, partial [bacterium]|nr:group II intron reverse transcriptase/maturase [bacterium]